MTDALQKLHTTMLDTHDGYATAERDADDETLKLLFRRIIEQRERDHEELHAALTAQGKEPDDRRSVMAVVHKAAVDVRATVTGINESSLRPFISGEEDVLARYDAAIAEAGGGSTGVMLQKQKKGIEAVVEAMRAYKDQ